MGHQPSSPCRGGAIDTDVTSKTTGMPRIADFSNHFNLCIVMRGNRVMCFDGFGSDGLGDAELVTLKTKIHHEEVQL